MASVPLMLVFLNAVGLATLLKFRNKGLYTLCLETAATYNKIGIYLVLEYFSARSRDNLVLFGVSVKDG